MQFQEQLTFDIGFQPSYTREDFLVSAENKPVLRMLDNLSLWKSHCMLLYGGRAAGKTHLANIFVNAHQGSHLIMEAKDLKEEDIPDIAANNNYVVLENAGEGVSEVCLFHLFNFTKDSGTKLLITAEKNFMEWNLQLPDLLSRLNTAMVMSIPLPTDEMMIALLLKMFTDKQMDVGEEVLTYMVGHMERSFSAIRDIVEKTDKLSLLEHRKITIPLVKRVLSSDNL